MKWIAGACTSRKSWTFNQNIARTALVGVVVKQRLKHIVRSEASAIGWLFMLGVSSKAIHLFVCKVFAARL